MELSIIIPTLNEAGNIASLLQSLPGYPDMEVIVADGGSKDHTLELARRGGAITTVSSPGRGNQLNRGAALAKGKTLFFLHADCRITLEGILEIVKTMKTGKYQGGAFYLSLDRKGKFLDWVVRGANLRSRFLKIAYGDQGIFVDARRFQALEGFKEVPLMEDDDFFRRLRKSGEVLFIEKGLTTSSRRWEREGVLYVTLRNWTLYALYRLGVSPFVLDKWYPRIRGRTPGTIDY